MKNCAYNWQRSFFLPREGCARSLRGTPHLCSSWKDQAPLQIFYAAKILLLRHPVLSQSRLAGCSMSTRLGWHALHADAVHLHGRDQRVRCAIKTRSTGRGWLQSSAKHERKEGRELGAPSAPARLAPKSLKEMGQYLLSSGGTPPSLLGLGVI